MHEVPVYITYKQKIHSERVYWTTIGQIVAYKLIIVCLKLIVYHVYVQLQPPTHDGDEVKLCLVVDAGRSVANKLWGK